MSDLGNQNIPSHFYQQSSSLSNTVSPENLSEMYLSAKKMKLSFERCTELLKLWVSDLEYTLNFGVTLTDTLVLLFFVSRYQIMS